MINKIFINKLKKDYQLNERERIKIIVFSNDILHQSKKIIFSLQRGQIIDAQKNINLLKGIIIKKQEELGLGRLEQEGSYRAALEEFTEACLFAQWLGGKKINRIDKIKINYASYLGGLSDLCGEIARFCVNAAAKKESKIIEKAYEDVLEIISHLNQFNLTGSLRNKYDQACNHLRKIEQVNYDLKIRSL